MGTLGSLGLLGNALVGCTTLSAGKREQRGENQDGQPNGQPNGQPSNTHILAGLTDFTGKEIALPALVDEVTLVDFWASWCPSCHMSFRYIDTLYQQYRDRGFNVLAISLDEDAQAAQRFINRMRVRFPVAWDPDGLVGERFYVENLPTSFLFNQDGEPLIRHEGFSESDAGAFDGHIRALLGEAPVLVPT